MSLLNIHNSPDNQQVVELTEETKVYSTMVSPKTSIGASVWPLLPYTAEIL